MAGKRNDAKLKNSKSGKKNVSAQAALWTLALIALAVAIIVVSSLLLPGIGSAMRGGPGHFGERGEMPQAPERDIAFIEENFALRAGLSALNVMLAIYLLYIYVKDYLALRSSFTLGIVAVLFSFFLYALTSSPMLRLVMGQYGIASTLSFVPMFFSAIGLLIFAKLGNE